MTMMRKMGRLRPQTRQELVMDGSARSARRVMRGPEAGPGAAMRVRWGGRRASLRSGGCRRRESACRRMKFWELRRRELAFCGGILSWRECRLEIQLQSVDNGDE